MVISQKMVTLPGDIKHKTPMVSFAGNSGSGKTTLLEKVVRELKERGYRVAVIKHSHHSFELDIPGKDTWRFAAAGNAPVVTGVSRATSSLKNRR